MSGGGEKGSDRDTFRDVLSQSFSSSSGGDTGEGENLKLKRTHALIVFTI